MLTQVNRVFFVFFKMFNIFNNTGLAILPINPMSGYGWKEFEANHSHLVNASQAELKKGIEENSYMYQEVVLEVRHAVSHRSLLSTYSNGLVQILESTSNSLTFSGETSQSLLLASYPQYYLAFFDPTFAVISGNPDTIPRTLVPIPSNAGRVYIYLRVTTWNVLITNWLRFS